MRLVLRLLILIAGFVPDASFAHSLKVVSFNILAPPWASPVYYPHTSAPLLAREARRCQIIAVLKGFKDSADMICLQEVTPIEYGYIKDALEGFAGFQVNHSKDYWAHYITADLPWEQNGNAIFVKQEVFNGIRFSELPLSGEGNISAYMEAEHKGSGKRVRLLCVHLDSDSPKKRSEEIGCAFSHLGPPEEREGGSVDLIVGDLNSNPALEDNADQLRQGNYVDLHLSLGVHKATMSFENDNIHKKIDWQLDHILLRNGIPSCADVFDLDLYETFPIVQEYRNEGARVEAGLKLIGSDHFPVWGVFDF